MSGPKDTEWDIEEETRRMLAEARSAVIERRRIIAQQEEEERRIAKQKEEERREREKQTSKLESDIAGIKKNIKTSVESFVKDKNNFIREMMSFESEAEVMLQEMKSEINDLEQLKNYLINKQTSRELEKLQELKDELNTSEIQNRKSSINNIENKVFVEVKNKRSSEVMSRINNLGTSLDFSVKRNDKAETVDNKIELENVHTEFKDIFDRFNDSKFIKDKSLLRYKNSEVTKLINDETIDDSYKISQISLFTRDIYAEEDNLIREEENNKKVADNYLNKYRLYKILCSEAGTDINIKEETDLISAGKNTDYLDAEIEKLNNIIAEKDRYDYIVKNVNEVMDQFGYDILSSEVVTRPDRSIADNIYKFDNNSVLNVYTSDNGTVMFEVSGLSTEKKEMTSLEKLHLKESMVSFCSKYDSIKEELAKRGIKFNNEHLRPADVKYSKIRTVKKERLNVKNKSREVRKESNKRYLNN